MNAGDADQLVDLKVFARAPLVAPGKHSIGKALRWEEHGLAVEVEAGAGLPPIYDYRLMQWLMTLAMRNPLEPGADGVAFVMADAAREFCGDVSGRSYGRLAETLTPLRETRVTLIETKGDDAVQNTFRLLADFEIGRGSQGAAARFPAYVRRKLRDPGEVFHLDPALYDPLPPLMRALCRFVRGRPEIRRGSRVLVSLNELSRGIGARSDLKSFGLNLRKTLPRAQKLFPAFSMKQVGETMMLDLKIGKALDA